MVENGNVVAHLTKDIPIQDRGGEFVPKGSEYTFQIAYYDSENLTTSGTWEEGSGLLRPQPAGKQLVPGQYMSTFTHEYTISIEGKEVRAKVPLELAFYIQ